MHGMMRIGVSLVVIGMQLVGEPAAADEEPPTDAISFSQRDDFGRPLEPRGDFILHGAGQRAWEFSSYWHAIGENKPIVSKRYLHLNGAPHSILKELRELGYEMQSYGERRLILELSIHMKSIELDGPSFCREIVQGKHDAAIDAFADGLATFKGAPVFVRLGYEFNGHWNGYEPESYVAAYRYVHDRISARQIPNLAWVWCYIPAGARLEYRSFYPGDEYVDWWGIDLFRREQIEHPMGRRFIHEARERRYPVLISESTPEGIGVADADRAWDRFFEPYFTLIAEHPNIKGFCYINREWPLWEKYPGWEDGRLDHNPELLERYRRLMAAGVFLHRGSGEDSELLHLAE